MATGFFLIEILAWIAEMLAANEISNFAISTYSIDYILMNEEKYYKALEVLKSQF